MIASRWMGQVKVTPARIESNRSPLAAAAASMETGMRSIQAAPEEVRTRAEASVRTVPEAHGSESAAQNLAEGGLQGGEVKEVDEIREYFGYETSNFRDTWNWLFSRYRGCFEDTTKIPNKHFTYRKPRDDDLAGLQPTLQIFSLKIAKVRVGLQWPLQVFGMVAIRDCVDRNRNIIFDRPRHHCQIVTREDPYLKLTGPSRAVVVVDPGTFEVDLKLKGTTESEDQWLSFLAVTYCHFPDLDSHLFEREYASKLSELQFQLGSIIYSVEATIEARITSGSWPHGFRAQFTASTASIPGAEIILLDSGDNEEGPRVEKGSIKLSRCVASVENNRELRLCVKAFLGDKIVVNKVKSFKSKKSGISDGSLSVDFYREVSKAKTKTAGKGEDPPGVGLNRGAGFLGRCKFGFIISWSVIAVFPG